MIIGIICEYNPFHNGHLYQIKKIKEMYPNCTLVAIMSGNFVQRGEFSILEKYDKTRICLNYGIDLVVEIPTVYCVQSADVFARASVKIAHMIGCNAICFGAEHDNIDYFYKNIDISNKSEYDIEIKKLLKEGLNYPTATSHALKNLGGDDINKPNDILALRYIKEILNNNYDIKPIIIKRTSDFNDVISNDNIISANNIRLKIKNSIDIKNYVPNKCYEIISNSHIPNIDNYYNLLRYNIIVNKDRLCEYSEVNEDIANKLIKYIYRSNNINEFINNIKSKNDTLNKINRIIIHVLLNIKKDNNIDINNIRILGFNNNGKYYLNSIKKEINLITKFSELNDKEKNIELFLNYIYYYEIYSDKYLNKVIENKVIYE